jgi:MFS family permease
LGGSLLAREPRRDDHTQLALRRALTAAVVDVIGEGMFVPLTFLFFVLTTKMGTAAIGTAVSIGTLMAWPTGLLAASVVDRFGARRMVAANNLLSAVGYACYLFVRDAPELVGATFIVMAADRIYWASWPEFVAKFGETRGFERMFARFNAWRSGALGVGYLIGGGVLGLSHSVLSARLIVVANMVSCSFAAFLMLRAGDSDNATRSSRKEEDEIRGGVNGWRSLFSNKLFILLSASNFAIAFAWLIPSMILPVYLIKTLGLPRWLPGVVLAVNVAMGAGLQLPVTRLASGLRRSRVMAISAGFMILAVCLAAAMTRRSYAESIGLAFGCMIAFSLGEISSGPTASAMAVNAAPAADRGRYLGFFAIAFTASGIVGPALVGVLLQVDVVVLWIVLVAVITLGGIGFMVSEAIGQAHD